MSKAFSVTVFCLLVVSASGQWLETTILLPDSVGGIVGPHCVAYCAESNSLFIGGQHGDGVLVVDASTMRRVAKVPAGRNVVALCVNSSERKVYAAAAGSNTVSVIDAASNSLIATVPTPGYPAALCYDPIQNRVYCACRDADRVFVIDGRSDSVLRRVTVGEGPVALTFNPRDNKLYCANSVSDDVTVISGRTGRRQRTIDVGRTPVALCYNSTDNKVYSANWSWFSHNLSVIDGTGDTVVRSIDAGDLSYPSALYYSSTANKVYCANSGRDEVVIISGAADTIVARVRSGDEPCAVVGTALTIRGGRVFSLSRRSGTGVLIDETADTVTAVVELGPEATAACYDWRNRRFLAASRDGDEVVAVDAMGGAVLSRVVTGVRVGPVCFANGKVYCLGSGRITVVDASANRPLSTIRTGGEPYGICFDSSRSKLYCTDNQNDCLIVIDAQTDSILRRVPVGRHPHGVCVAWRDCKVYVANSDGRSLTVVSTATDSVLTTIAVPTYGYPHSLCYNPVHRKMYCGIYDAYQLAVVDCRRDSFARFISEAVFSARRMCYDTLRGKLFCANNRSDGFFTVIDGSTDSVLAVLPARGRPYGICLADAESKVYGSDVAQGVVYAIDASANRLVATIPVSSSVTSVEYCPSGGDVYCASPDDNTVSTIDAATDSVTACFRVGQYPRAFAWAPFRNRMYVTEMYGSSLSVIRAVVAIADRDSVTSVGAPVLATPVRAVLRLTPPRGPARCWSLFDISGRKCAELRPGPNDVQHLTPGVYFVREVGGRERVGAQKVVITR